MQVQHRGTRPVDPSMDLPAMLVPLTHFRQQRHTLSAYDTSNSNGEQISTPHRALHQRVQQHRTQAAHRQQNQSKSTAAAAASKAKSPLAILQAEQAALKQRKMNVARFGSSWLRPAGVPKTYQAMMDEMAEREEQEAQARREAAAAEEHRAAQAAALANGTRPPPTTRPPRVRRGAIADGANLNIFDGESAMDVDLVNDVPEADEVEYDDEEDEDENEDDDVEEDQDVTEERDLDESIPEAGSYQHTDTDVEDDDDDDSSISMSISEHMAQNPNTDGGVPPENALHPPRILDGATGRFVHSIEGTSEFMPVQSPETSMLVSSPAEAREREIQSREDYLIRRSMQ